MMKPIRIVTLAQLAVLPVGTLFSPIRFSPPLDKGGKAVMEFDIQGTLQLDPTATLTSVSEHWLVAVDVLPDVKITDGRMKYQVTERSYMYPNSSYPHRFVVWEEVDVGSLSSLLA